MLDRFDAKLDGAFGLLDRETLLARLRQVLPGDRLIATAESMRPYESDGLAAYRSLPAAVALPADADEAAAVLKVCRELGVPVVARGAGTGLSGGALPFPGSVLLALGKLNRILAIDPIARTARVQPGVRNLAISEAVKPYGLFYAPDPSSQLACSIGGNVAENAGGVHCLKYGLTVHNILKLEALTIEGERLTIGSDALDAPGFDLMALMTGSEGLLGVVTEITVRLLPLPADVQALLVAFPDAGCAAQAVADIIAAGITPAGLEMMDSLALQAAETYAHAGYPQDAGAILICECDGAAADAEAELAHVAELCRAAGANLIHHAKDEAERARLWAGRKAAFPAMGRLAPDYYCIDGTIPRRRLPEVLATIAELSRTHGLAVANVFHAGDGNLHPLILYDANQPGDLERAEAFGADILRLCVEVGGVLTGEHGVGVEKRDLMPTMFSDIDLAQQQRLKCAFDERGLLNPGKVFPELHRCAELGRLHVHHGALPHPDLPRF